MGMKRLIFITIIIVATCSLCGCKKTHDTIEIYNRSFMELDNIYIDIKPEFFYNRHEKFGIDENTVGVTVYFTKKDDGEWELKGGESDA